MVVLSFELILYYVALGPVLRVVLLLFSINAIKLKLIVSGVLVQCI